MFRKSLLFLSLLFALAVAPTAILGKESAQQLAERGHVDAVVLDSSSRRMRISGWIGTPTPVSGAPVIEVFVGNQLAYAGPFEQFDRPDVAAATGRPEWLNSGLRASFRLADSIQPGKHAVRVDAILPTGKRFTLAPVDAAAAVTVPKTGPQSWAMAWEVLAIGCVILFVLLAGAAYLSRGESTHVGNALPVALTATAILLLFAWLVAAGSSGSSIRLALESQPVRGLSAEIVIGHERGIRSDEWVVQTPWAIGQATHEPRFPVINRNLGLDGQNMLVVGGTGVPVAHPSSIGRPATWGYFFLDLPQGMAWHWWFPIFSLLLVSWAFFFVLFPGSWTLALALSTLLAASPYMAAWSFTPAYVVMLGNACFCLAYALLAVRNGIARSAIAAALGIVLAGFALVLYPASQVPIAYLYLFAFVGVLLRDRGRLEISRYALLFFLVAAGIAALVLLAWWQDAKESVAIITETLYPGKRALVTGGDMEPWSIAKGFVSPITMYGDLRGYSNQSEIASFIYFLVPSAVAVLWAMGRTRKLDPVSISLIGFLALVLAYQYFGFAPWLAKWSLWGRTTAARADIALGLAAIALIGAAFHLAATNGKPTGGTRLIDLVAILTGLAWAALIGWALRKAPDSVTGLLGPGLLFGIVVMAGFGSLLLVQGRAVAFFALAMTASMAASVPFNPLVVFSARISAAPLVSSLLPDCDRRNGRGLVLGSQVPAALMMAAGCPVLNGVFLYPQPTLWARLDPESRHRPVYNRYQHLVFVPEALPENATYALESPQADLVRVKLDPARFDFRTVGVDYVLAPRGVIPALLANPSLERRGSGSDEWGYFAIRQGERHGTF
jgi:hypothetical protein